MRAFKTAKILQLLKALLPQQIVDGVEDRAGMGLDRDPILGPQHREIQRGHDRRQRGRGGLMAADLQSARIGAQVIGVVDGPGGQPQHLPLEFGQIVERGFFHGASPLALSLEGEKAACECQNAIRLCGFRVDGPGFAEL